MNRRQTSENEREGLLAEKISSYGDVDNENDNQINKSRISSLSDTLNDKCISHRKPSRLEWTQSSWTRLLHVFLFWWVNPVLSLGFKQTIINDDLDDLPHHDKSSGLLNKLLVYDWSSTTTLRIIVRAFGKETLCVGLFIFPYTLARLTLPLFIRAIVQEIDHKHDISHHSKAGIGFAIGLFLCFIIQGVLYQQIRFRSTRIGMKIRNALTSTIYRRLLSIKISSLQQSNSTQTINLVTNDTNKFEDLWGYIHFLWAGPLETSITVALLYWIIGALPTLFGLTVLLMLVPIQLTLSRLFSQYRQMTFTSTDQRINIYSELLNGCQIVKMYNWEKAMERRVLQMREEELVSIKRANHLRALNFGLFFASSCLIAFAAFGGIWILGYELKAADIFAALAFFGQIRIQLVNLMPLAIERLSSVIIASKRIDTFMQLETIQLQKRQSRSTTNTEGNNKLGTIIMRDASFSWQDDNTCLSSLNINIQSGQLVGIVGSVGAGKSSLFSAILGEMNLTNGDIQVNGSLSYAAQTAWIFADTIRANILLGKKFDEERYQRVLHTCCLDIDLRTYGKVGDMTIVGEKGITLSSGQKARVSLARALYVDANIYLLDDPLSAVDPKVAKRIFDACIGPEGLLKGKTRLFITHQTHFLIASDQCILFANGRIMAQGLSDQLPIEYEHINKSNNDTVIDKPIDEVQAASADELDVSKTVLDTKSILHDEISASGRISWSVWRQLFTAPPLGWFHFCLLIAFLLVGEVLFDTTLYWLALWSKRTYPTQQQLPKFAYIYTALTVATLIIAIVRVDYLLHIILRGSSHLHNSMLKGILYTSMRFFESNSVGRIINRASRDQQIIDELLPMTMCDAIQSLITTIGSLTIVGLINPAVLLVLIIAIPSYWYILRYYLRTSRQLKRLENVTRSPIYAFFSSSLNGLATIRALKVKEDFVQTFLDRIDAHTRVYIMMTGATNWFGTRFDSATALFSLFTALFAILMRSQIDPSLVALSLVFCLNMSGQFQWGIRQLCEAENYATSAERIDEYAHLLPEQDDVADKGLIQTSADWPSHGSIEFRNYTLRYRSELDPVLYNIDIRIEPSEKIGIIGRTGAGKSSLFQALFRFVERSAIDGKILIDGIDISRLTLDHLRSHLSIIPQIPILFSGTLRYNLDPFEIYTDEQCLATLEAVQLKHRVINHPAGLYLPVAESGSNFSVGECQLICIARAILKQSKILLIDEATANVDLNTDALIQAIIKDKFCDRTILTIAHRLNTVAKSDRILVMEHGRVLNCDVPENILHEQYHK